MTTYILLIGFLVGRENAFKPEILGMTATSSIALIIFEFGIIKLGSYLLDIGAGASIPDILAVSGYKFVRYIHNIESLKA